MLYTLIKALVDQGLSLETSVACSINFFAE